MKVARQVPVPLSVDGRYFDVAFRIDILVEDRLVIGSAAVCPYSEPDWQEGAVAAGWQTVKTIHERAMKT